MKLTRRFLESILRSSRVVYPDVDELYIYNEYGRIVAVAYIPYNETHFRNLNLLLVEAGLAEVVDYPNGLNLNE